MQEINIKEMSWKRRGLRFKDSKPYHRKWNKETDKIIKRADSLIYNIQWANSRFSISCKKENIHDEWRWLLLLPGKKLTFRCPSFIVYCYSCPLDCEQRLKIRTPTPFTAVIVNNKDNSGGQRGRQSDFLTRRQPARHALLPPYLLSADSRGQLQVMFVSPRQTDFPPERALFFCDARSGSPQLWLCCLWKKASQDAKKKNLYKAFITKYGLL